jgi:branched-chain amino acid transport system substrate-binding protein
MHTAATEKFSRYLSAAGVAGEPTYADYTGYTTVGLLLRGLQAAGPNPSKSSLITAFSGIHSWDDHGLPGGLTLDINNRTYPTQGPHNCAWITRFEGHSFQLVPGADPICGKILPGITVGAG